MNMIERRLLDAINKNLSQNVLTTEQNDEYMRGWNAAIVYCKELLEFFVASRVKNAQIIQFIKKHEDNENEVRRFYN